jgi:hypothetical protein
VVARRAARLAQLARQHRRGRRAVAERLEHPQPQRVREGPHLPGAERAEGKSDGFISGTIRPVARQRVLVAPKVR